MASQYYKKHKKLLTQNRHVIVDLHDDPSGQELTREEEQVGVVEQDQELDQLPRHVRHFFVRSNVLRQKHLTFLFVIILAGGGRRNFLLQKRIIIVIKMSKDSRF